MSDQFQRFQLIIGPENMAALKNKKVAIFGVGGVGGSCVEALARCGINNLVLVDNDSVSESNINRQVIATYKSVGRDKVDVMKERILDINPDANVETHKMFLLPENTNDFDFASCDYVVDCIDTVSAKISMIVRCKELGVPVISAMGAGNKMNPTMLEVADLSKTSVCPLARVMRKELKNRGIEHLKVVYSKEVALSPISDESMEAEAKPGRRTVPGSAAFVPPVAGMILASEVVKDLIAFDPENRS